MEEGEATDAFLGPHVILYWGRVSMEVGLVVGRIFGGKKRHVETKFWYVLQIVLVKSSEFFVVTSPKNIYF